MAREDGIWLQDWSTGDNLKINADGSLNVAGSFSTSSEQSSGFAPDPSSYIDGTANTLVDSEQHLQVRGQVLTDEQSFRDDFSGASLTTTLTGTVTFVNGGTAITGSGTLFLTELVIGQYIRASAHANGTLAKIASIESNTALTLESGYTGASVSSSAVRSNWAMNIGTGGAISVGSSIVTIGAGTTNGSVTGISRFGDYLPYTINGRFSLSQRIANQEFIFGFTNATLPLGLGAYFRFAGTTNTVVECVVRSSTDASDSSSLTVTIPAGGTTAGVHSYSIDLCAENATFLIDGIIVGKLEDHVPGPYQVINISAFWNNTAAPASNTNALINSVYFSNVNIVDVTNRFSGIPTNIILPVGQPVLQTGTLVTTAVTANQVVLTYTVTAGKTFYLQYVQMDGYRTTLPGNTNPVLIGNMSLETPSGTKAITLDRFHVPSAGVPFQFSIPIPSGTVIRIVVTPSAATSTTWRANFGGYEI